MDIIAQLERDEGVRPSAYQDSLGYWTVGIGFCIDERKGCGLEPDEINWLLQNRVNKLAIALTKAFAWFFPLDAARQGVLLNMSYQLGVAGLQGFSSMLGAINAQDYQSAAGEMLNSTWARTQSPGRAARLAEQMRSGVWQ